MTENTMNISGNEAGSVTEGLPNFPSPEDVVAGVIADGRTAGSDGTPRVGRATRKKAHEVTAALRAAGWRILR